MPVANTHNLVFPHRMVFMHLRISVEHLAANPKCPAVVGNVLLKIRDVVIRLCPQQ